MTGWVRWRVATGKLLTTNQSKLDNKYLQVILSNIFAVCRCRQISDTVITNLSLLSRESRRCVVDTGQTYRSVAVTFTIFGGGTFCRHTFFWSLNTGSGSPYEIETLFPAKFCCPLHWPADECGGLEVDLVHGEHHGHGAALPLHLLLPPAHVLQRRPVSRREGQQAKMWTSEWKKLWVMCSLGFNFSSCVVIIITFALNIRKVS